MTPVVAPPAAGLRSSSSKRDALYALLGELRRSDRRLQRRRRQRLPGLRGHAGARRPRPLRHRRQPELPRAASRSSRSRIAARFRPPARDHHDRRDWRGPSIAPIRPTAATSASTSSTPTSSAIGRERGIPVIADGSNADDRGDYRPGRQAAREFGVRSPLDEVGLTKDEIRELSHDAGLPTWDEPASACLSSRIPYFSEVTDDEAADDRAGRERAARSRASASAASGITTRSPGSRSAATRWRARSSPRSPTRIDRELRALGYQHVTHRSARLSPRQPERRAPAAPDLSPPCAEAPAPALAGAVPARASRRAPPALDDIDAVNFTLGVRDFDVAQHQPHPPGYPVFIALGKLSTPVLRAAGVAAPEVARPGGVERARRTRSLVLLLLRVVARRSMRIRWRPLVARCVTVCRPRCSGSPRCGR